MSARPIAIFKNFRSWAFPVTLTAVGVTLIAYDQYGGAHRIDCPATIRWEGKRSMTASTKIYVPVLVGRHALDELDRVDWTRLAHAYGVGKTGRGLHDDVAATLRQLGATDPAAFEEAVDAAFSNLCHQGTIYQATAHAVPFLAALAAGEDLTRDQGAALAAILAEIGFAASYEAPEPSTAGSWGPGVAPLTREAFRASSELLTAAARRNPQLHETVAALAAMVRTDPPDPEAVECLERLLPEVEEPM